MVFVLLGKIWLDCRVVINHVLISVVSFFSNSNIYIYTKHNEETDCWRETESLWPMWCFFGSWLYTKRVWSKGLKHQWTQLKYYRQEGRGGGWGGSGVCHIKVFTGRHWSLFQSLFRWWMKSSSSNALPCHLHSHSPRTQCYYYIRLLVICLPRV